METWSAHHFFNEASTKLGENVATNLLSYSQELQSRKIPVVISLRHLAKITNVKYRLLHETVNRKRESSNYRMYAVKKRSGGRRFIHSVSANLFQVQRFINSEILQQCQPHASSFAFHASGGIRKCAAMHCGARWLFQFDLADFFYDVTEVDVYKIFKNLGYRPLLAFEMARLCTTTRLPSWQNNLFTRYFDPSDYSISDDIDNSEESAVSFPYIERFGVVGVLPQGAPSSPMLANFAAYELDKLLYDYSKKCGFVYSRYADDITLSATNLKESKEKVRRSVINIIRQAGFAENPKKCRIAGPGSKKIVLGLLVDGSEPRISKAMYRRIDRLLYGTLKYGFEAAAAHNKFDSGYGFHNHLSGLISFVKSVDKKRWIEFTTRMTEIKNKYESDEI